MAFAALALIAAPQRSSKSRPTAPAPASLAVPAAPFHTGEILNYTVQWSMGNSGFRINDGASARLAVLGQQNFFGRPAWHVQAQAHTNNPLRYLFVLDDQFDSYASSVDLTGIQFEMYLHEQGKAENHIYRLSSVSAPAPDGATQVQVLPNTRDALGFAYFLRTVNWDQAPEVRTPVFDGRKIYVVQARATTPRTEVTVRAGKFDATGISLRVFDRGTELTDTKLKIWIAHDSAHTPVLIEVELTFGTGRVELLNAGLAR
ncbi:MAG TPA: DUF3108 domain-containing protein [Candidatus Acidoferrum sp.]|nr:DUF3108 domain-containing protein [Candidatus Acidoferrum sp.]